MSFPQPATAGSAQAVGERPAAGGRELVVDEVCKRFARRDESGQLLVLDRISFGAAEGSFTTIIGPSGCGKSTLLRCIAGLASYDSGSIRLGDSQITMPHEEISVVFQAPSLLPWRSVLRNVLYGVSLRRTYTKAECERRAREALALVGLSEFERHYPHELSGGMQQRVNLARALATGPKLLLMDEPFGALDALTKERLQDELGRLSGSQERTTIFVTHDIEEALFLGDQVVVMTGRPGGIAEIVPLEIPRPRSRDMLETPQNQALLHHLRGLLRGAS